MATPHDTPLTPAQRAELADWRRALNRSQVLVTAVGGVVTGVWRRQAGPGGSLRATVLDYDDLDAPVGDAVGALVAADWERMEDA